MNPFASWLTPARWPWLAGAFAALMLAAAHAFQAAGYAPCTLCLRQREVYWVLLALVAAWAVAARFVPRVRASRLVPLTVALVFLFSFALAAYHAGVEWKWWPGPTACASGASGPLSVDDLSGVLSGATRVRPPACDEAAWVFAGLSMAGWNALASLVMAGLSLLTLSRSRRPWLT